MYKYNINNVPLEVDVISRGSYVSGRGIRMYTVSVVAVWGNNVRRENYEFLNQPNNLKREMLPYLETLLKTETV